MRLSRSHLFVLACAVLAALIGCGGGGGSSSGNTTALTNGGTSSTASTSSTSSTGEGTPNVLHFDDLAAVSSASGNTVTPNARLSTQYQNSLGVKFSSGSDYVAVVQLPQGAAPTPPNAIAGVSPTGTVSYSRTNAIDITFWDPTSPTQKGAVKYFKVTADNDGPSNQDLVIEAYDKNGTFLKSQSFNDVGGETLFLEADQPVIHRVRILGSQGEANGIAIDDVTFKPVVRA